MFVAPNGWNLERTAGAVVLGSRHGAGTIIVEEGVRATGPSPVWPDAERVVTCEGERALFAMAGSTSRGIVLLDETCIRIEGRAKDPDRAHEVAIAVREIVVTTRVFLGHLRRRRFWYDAPPGWRYVASSGGDDTWLAPEYPGDRAAITVTHALPVTARDHLSIVKTLLGEAEDGSQPSQASPISTARGLSGQRWTRGKRTSDGIALNVDVIALTDGRYDYFARAIAPATRSLLSAIAESIVPLPEPPREVANPALAHWCA